MSNTIPSGVKLISVLLIISGLINALFGILALAMNPAVVFISILVNIFIIIVGVFLWLGENWARIAAIILALITIINGFGYLLMGNIFAVINIIINLIILFYLSLSKDVRDAFLSRKSFDEALYEYYEDYEDYPDETGSEGLDDEGFAEVLSVEGSKEDESIYTGPKMTFIVKDKEDEYY